MNPLLKPPALPRLALLLLSFACSMWAADPETTLLQQTVQSVVTGHHGVVTFFAEDLNTGRTVQSEPDKPVTTASVIKLPILMEALYQVRSGKIKLDDRLTLNKQDQVQGSGVLLFFDTPVVFTLKDALSMMLIMSDNTATNLVIDHLGLANINAGIRRMGLSNTYLYKKVFLPPAEPMSGALAEEQKRFGLGKTTAREMAQVMKRLYTCQLGADQEAPKPGDAALCSTALTILSEQFYRDCIPRYLDGWNAAGSGSGVAIANKTGSLDDVRNDVALVAAKRGPILISAFTYNNRDQSWQVDNEGELTIARLAKAVVENWSPEGLAPDTLKIKP